MEAESYEREALFSSISISSRPDLQQRDQQNPGSGSRKSQAETDRWRRSWSGTDLRLENTGADLPSYPRRDREEESESVGSLARMVV